MPYRICKSFEIESGHMLSKHSERCRFPHGHSRTIEIVISAEALDDNDMVCDFKAIKIAVIDYLDRLDHAMAINSDDPSLDALRATSDRIVVFEHVDPTTEILAKTIFDFVAGRITNREPVTDPSSDTGAPTQYMFPEGLKLERIRVSETSSSWAEYAAE